MSEYVPRLKAHYEEVVRPALQERFGYRNPMQVPRLQKVVLNMGMGEAAREPKLMTKAVEELTAIAGQKAVVTRARRSVAAFKLRQGMAIGCRVTLRGNRMWEFTERLIHLALPQVRDFRGVSRHGFDGRGNYTLGIREQIIFPEIDYDKVDRIKGMNVTFVTTAETDDEALALLRHLGMPFRK